MKHDRFILLLIYLIKTSNLVLECKTFIVCCSCWCSGLKILVGNLLTHPLVIERFMTEKNLKALHLYPDFPIHYNLIFNRIYSITERLGSQKFCRGSNLGVFMGPVEAWWPHAMLQVCHSDSNLTPKPWTSWYIYLIVYITHTIACCMNIKFIYQCCRNAWRFCLYKKRWEITDSNTTRHWQNNNTGHLSGIYHMPSLFCLTLQWIFTASLPRRKKNRLMTSQPKVQEYLELSWGHDRRLTEPDS